MPRWIVLLLAVLVLMSAACAAQPGMAPPRGWEGVSPSSSRQGQAGEGRMQVIICYSWFISSHACLLLEDARGDRLFWDPGGTFGDQDPARRRKRDVLLDAQALSLEALWEYRRTGCNEPYMLVFEWDIPAGQVERRRRILTQASPGMAELFNSDAPGGQCGVYVSRFLRQFCPEMTALRGECFWPHNLARQLWRCEPDRVMVYRRRQPVTLYARPGHRAADALQE